MRGELEDEGNGDAERLADSPAQDMMDNSTCRFFCNSRLAER